MRSFAVFLFYIRPSFLNDVRNLFATEIYLSILFTDHTSRVKTGSAENAQANTSFAFVSNTYKNELFGLACK